MEKTSCVLSFGVCMHIRPILLYHIFSHLTSFACVCLKFVCICRRSLSKDCPYGRALPSPLGRGQMFSIHTKRPPCFRRSVLFWGIGNLCFEIPWRRSALFQKENRANRVNPSIPAQAAAFYTRRPLPSARRGCPPPRCVRPRRPRCASRCARWTGGAR